jgi:hypothetical protein
VARDDIALTELALASVLHLTRTRGWRSRVRMIGWAE